MMPPVCAVCEEWLKGDGGLVKFSNYEPLPEGYVGHPRGYPWLCKEHKAIGEKLVHLTAQEAIEQMKEEIVK